MCVPLLATLSLRLAYRGPGLRPQDARLNDCQPAVLHYLVSLPPSMAHHLIFAHFAKSEVEVWISFAPHLIAIEYKKVLSHCSTISQLRSLVYYPAAETFPSIVSALDGGFQKGAGGFLRKRCDVFHSRG